MAKGNPRQPRKKVELPKPEIEEFMTRPKANEGHKIPLYTADGRLTAHWLRVLGIDSDVFRKVQAQQIRRIAEISELPEEERETAYEDVKLELAACLVADWSFDKPCTHENVKAFLRDAPQIRAEVDKLASRRTFFFKTPLGSLMPSPAPPSN